MQPTDIHDPDYFHKVVDCQWACPAHTPVPEYIRLIAAGRYTASLAGGVKGMRIAVIKEGFGHPNSEADVDAHVRDAAQRLAQRLRVVQEAGRRELRDLQCAERRVLEPWRGQARRDDRPAGR